MNDFACCSSYIKCSDMRKCIHENDEEYINCQYKKNLVSGLIFYGVNKANVQIHAASNQNNKPDVYKRFEEYFRLFIDCYERFFHVGKQDKNGYTYIMESDELQTVLEFLLQNKVPLVKSKISELNNDKCLLESDPVNPSKMYRVIFTMPGTEQKYIVGNYNSCYILEKYAAGILKSFLSRGIKAYLDIIERQVNAPFIKPSEKYAENEKNITEYSKKIIHSNVNVIQPSSNDIQSVKKNNKQVYGQISLFETMRINYREGAMINTS